MKPSLFFQGLEVLISNQIGTKVKFNVTERNNYFSLESNELVKETGLMAHVYESCKITSYIGTGPNTASGWRIVVDLRFTYKNGGGKGTVFGEYQYSNDTNEWERLK